MTIISDSDSEFDLNGPDDDNDDNSEDLDGDDTVGEAEADHTETDTETDTEADTDTEAEADTDTDTDTDEATDAETDDDEFEIEDRDDADEPDDEADDVESHDGDFHDVESHDGDETDDDPAAEADRNIDETEVGTDADDEAAADTGEPDHDAGTEPTDEHGQPAAHRIEPGPEMTPAPAMTLERPQDSGPPGWSLRQVSAVVQRVLALLVILGMVGYGLGYARGGGYMARTEFVYTLDESVPDSFLREDRRLLTQVVTFKSDAVLTPVAERFELTVDDLRAKIDVETLELSEVLRLDISDPDPDRAVAISRAVLDRYLQVITDAAPADDNQELEQRRVEVAAELADADANRRALLTAGGRDAALEVREQAIQRQIDLKNEQVNRMQGSIDDSFVKILSSVRRANLVKEMEVAQQELALLETELATVGTERAELVVDTTAEPALLREIERLESKLDTIDDELTERELAPLVASPIRELSQPLTLFRSAHVAGLQGMAIGLLAAIPLAGLLAYHTRKRQLWFDETR